MDTRRRARAQLVDNSVDPAAGRAVSSVLPEGAVRNRRHRDHIKDLRSTPVASGASLPGPDGFGRSRPGDDRPTDCDRHPGVGTSVGPSAQRASAAVCPLDAHPEARTPVTADTDPDVRPRPPDRAGRPAGPDRRPRGRRSRPLGPRAEGRDRPRLRARRARRRPRGRGRDPVRRPARLAGRDGARSRRTAAARPAGWHARRHAPGPLPHLRGQRSRARRPAGPALRQARCRDRRPDQCRGRRRSGASARGR